MKSKLLRVGVVLTVLVGALVVSACRRAVGGEARGRFLVVTTVTMVTDLVREIGGERVEVVGLMAAGMDPHTFKPRLSDAGLLEEASAVFYCGLHLEGKMQEGLERMAERREGIHAVTDGIPKERLLVPQEEFQGHYDPHVWGDPEMWVFTVDVVPQYDPGSVPT